MLLAALVLAAADAPSSVRGAHVVASLGAEQAWVRPGRPLALGLRLQMDPEWHTYWSNPGDSGLATRIRWAMPPGFEAGPIGWPVPERFVAGPLGSYGYAGEVLLLAEVRSPATLAPGSSVVIEARVDWLECKEVCRPGRADLSLRLPVQSADPPVNTDWAKAFDHARARLPRQAAPWAIAARIENGSLTLRVRGAAAPREAYFFPASPDLVEHGAPQPLSLAKGGFGLRVPLTANAKLPRKLEGVLEVDGTGYAVKAGLGLQDPKGGRP
jgi:DsbC/DsbD-like thiol-disulfide interchange protein